MADGLCGPSNALQNFQKHSTVDRTLQQDRLSSRRSPSQGFRTGAVNNGFLDPEFEAFQAAQNQFPQSEEQLLGQHQFSSARIPSQRHQQPPAAWANDFQRLQISSPVPQSHLGVQHQQQTGNWQQEFAQQKLHQAGPSRSQQMGYNAPLERLSSIAAMPHSFTPMYQNSQYVNQNLDTFNQEPSGDQIGNFDEEAFARAFDEAAQSDIARDVQESSDAQLLLDESAERLMGTDAGVTRRLGADLIHDSSQENDERPIPQNDPDALSRTAGHLLDKVNDNKSDKFQNSEFLRLMRQLRDKQVTVEGDKIVNLPPSEGNSVIYQ